MDIHSLILQLEPVIVRPFMLVDPCLTVLHLNAAMRALLRLDPEDLALGQPYDEVLRPVSPQTHDCAVMQAFRQKTAQRCDAMAVQRAQDGATLRISALTVPLLGEEGAPLAALLCIDEVDAQGNIETRLREQIERLEAERAQLETVVHARTRTLFDTHDELLAARRQLAELRHRLIVY